VQIERVGSGSGVELRSKTGFEVLVNGHTWVSTPVISNDATSVTVAHVSSEGTSLSSSSSPPPTKIRYLWYSNPCGKMEFGCAVYVGVSPIGNETGELKFLPLGPFIADLPHA
jgi:hypothetical protein